MKIRYVSLVSWDTSYYIIEGTVSSDDLQDFEPLADELSQLASDEDLNVRVLTIKYRSLDVSLEDDVDLIAENIVEMLKDKAITIIKQREFTFSAA